MCVKYMWSGVDIWWKWLWMMSMVAMVKSNSTFAP
jgi:hypothetical protein